MGNTNIESSWRLADEIFNNELNNNSNSKKDVIFFSDGYPNISVDYLYSIGYLSVDNYDYYKYYNDYYLNEKNYYLNQIYKKLLKKEKTIEMNIEIMNMKRL